MTIESHRIESVAAAEMDEVGDRFEGWGREFEDQPTQGGPGDAERKLTETVPWRVYLVEAT